MPELPEVETTLRGIEPHIINKKLEKVLIHNAKLRWPIPKQVKKLEGKAVVKLVRRAKYLQVFFDDGQSAVWHLGMSGSLRICSAFEERKKHDHVEWQFDQDTVLRYHDPRRFGALLWAKAGEEPDQFENLGPEPLPIYQETTEFSGEWLFERSRKRTSPIKTFIMDNKNVVGVGNIYANESLFHAGIKPNKPAGRVSKQKYMQLAECIQDVLAKAIKQGGSTLRDFVGGDGQPGYFQQELFVYGRTGEPCKVCGSKIKEEKIGQRSTFYCGRCQR